MYYLNMKVGIIGCGKMATNHLEKVIRIVPQGNIALCDKEIIKAQLLGELYNLDNLYDSLDSVIKEFNADVYHIVTPPATHKQLAIKCMEGGGHVYIEKPICLSVDDFDELKKVAVQCNKYVCAGHQRIFEKQYLTVKNLIQNNGLGRIIHIHAYDSGPYLEMEDQGLSKGWWSDFTGGMYVDLLPHIISVFNGLVDDLAFKHSFIRSDSQGRPSDMHGFYASGSSSATCSFHISFSTKLLQNYFKIECERGIVVLNLKNRFYYVIKKGNLPELVERLLINYLLGLKIAWANSLSILSLFTGRYDPYEGIGVLINKFYRAVLEQNDFPTALEDTRNVVKLCEQTIKSSFGSGNSNCKRSNSITGEQHLGEAEFLVTGATGFIGRHLVRRLLEDGKRVRIVSRRRIPRNYLGAGFKYPLQLCVGDILNPDFVHQACRGVESVYHLAAATKGDLFTQVEGTCVGTKNLLQAIKDNNVKRLIYVSSVSILDQTNYPKDGAIYDDFPYESHPLKRGAYTYSKLKAEKMVRAFQTENNMNTIVRPGIVWGPGSEQMLLETHFRIGNRFLIVLGQSKKRLPLIYVENLIDALVKAGNAESVNSDCFNIVDDNNPTQREYLQVLKEITGKRDYAVFIPISITLPLFWVCQKILGHMLRKPLSITYQMRSKNNRAVYSLEHAQNALGFNSKISFREGLIRYRDWLKQKRGSDQ